MQIPSALLHNLASVGSLFWFYGFTLTELINPVSTRSRQLFSGVEKSSDKAIVHYLPMHHTTDTVSN